MGVQPDTWIRKMALEHGMIEPFADRQVRHDKDDAGARKVISYGLSSYGYDLRVSDEFKVFTNVFNTVVDPKEFDARSFVDMQTDICIVPPNSLCLGTLGRIFPYPARHPHDLPGQINLRALRHHRQRHAVRAGVGGARHTWKFPTPRRYPPASTPTKAWPRFSFCRRKAFARCPMPTAQANI